MNLGMMTMLLMAGAMSAPEAPMLAAPRRRDPEPEPWPRRDDPGVATEVATKVATDVAIVVDGRTVPVGLGDLMRAHGLPLGFDHAAPVAPLNARQRAAEAKRQRRAERNLRLRGGAA